MKGRTRAASVWFTAARHRPDVPTQKARPRAVHIATVMAGTVVGQDSPALAEANYTCLCLRLIQSTSFRFGSVDGRS
jgi:hypothetical protein